MKIGNLNISNPVMAAPMAGITDKSFRLLAKEQGAGLVFTEMVSAKGLIYDNKKTMKLIDVAGELSPVGVQLFGAEPKVLAEGARMAEAAGANLVDLNMGCPAPKIVKQGEGVALMQNPQLACSIVAEVVKAVEVPVTVKIRLGWSKERINGMEFAKACVDNGAQAITVHGRTREQYYGGKADWELIGEIAEALPVPVIGNGDIKSPRDGAKMLSETKCQGIMIARASLGNPWIFSQTLAYLTAGVLVPPPTWEERLATALRHLDLVVADKGEYIGVREMRKQLAWYLKGFPRATEIRTKIFSATTMGEVKDILGRGGIKLRV